MVKPPSFKAVPGMFIFLNIPCIAKAGAVHLKGDCGVRGAEPPVPITPPPTGDMGRQIYGVAVTQRPAFVNQLCYGA